MNDLVENLLNISTITHWGPEGIYNEKSLIDELINHVLNKPTICKELWYEYFLLWEKYVQTDVTDKYNTTHNEAWFDYLENFLDRMDLIYDYSVLIFK